MRTFRCFGFFTVHATGGRAFAVQIASAAEGATSTRRPVALRAETS